MGALAEGLAEVVATHIPLQHWGQWDNGSQCSGEGGCCGKSL